jgi:hypothetical protein
MLAEANSALSDADDLKGRPRYPEMRNRLIRIRTPNSKS